MTMLNNYEMPWFKSYPVGLPHDINPDKYNSLVELMEDCFRKYENIVAYENMGKKISYKTLDNLSNAFASYLVNNLKMQPGDKIAIQLPNILQYPIVLLGSIKAGLTIVNLNPFYTSYEIESIMSDANVKCIVVLSNFAYKLEPILSNLPSLKHVIVTEVGDMLGAIKKIVVSIISKYIKKVIPPYKIPNAIKFFETIKHGSKKRFEKPIIDKEDLCFIQYTGSTTGKAKGVMLTHRNLLASVEQVSSWMRTRPKPKHEIIITALPLYHIFALSVNMLCMLNMGATNILITNPQAMGTFINELKKHKFTAISGVNTLFKLLLSTKSFKEVDFTSCTVCLGGGMTLDKAVVDEWYNVTGRPLIEGYGLTEASPVVACSPLNNDHVVGTVGLPLQSTIVKVVDNNNNELPIGVPGELLVKGPQVMKGYWNNQEETARAIVDGWLKTGDIAMIQENGFIKIIDRKKEMINVSGFNVYPSEIEAIAKMHPKIVEAAAIGIKDTRTGESVKLFVVPKDNVFIEKSEVIEHCRNFLTSYKIPRYVEFRDTLPKSPIGKVLKKELV